MSPQRRTALVSVGAAVVLMLVKLGTGLASGSLGLVSEALHSGTDLVAALLTFFAIGLAVRPADSSHPYGHGKAEHLAAVDAEGRPVDGADDAVAHPERGSEIAHLEQTFRHHALLTAAAAGRARPGGRRPGG